MREPAPSPGAVVPAVVGRLPEPRRRYWLWGLGALLAVIWLGGLTLAAVYASTRFVIRYASQRPGAHVQVRTPGPQ